MVLRMRSAIIETSRIHILPEHEHIQYGMYGQNTAVKCQSPMHAWGIMAIWASDRIAESTLSYLGFGGESCFWCGVCSLSSLYHTLSHILRNGIAFYLVNEMNSMPKCWTCLSMWLFVCLCVSECWRWTKPNHCLV